MKCTINGKYFDYVSDFRKQDRIRNSFNSLTQEVYGFDFEQWYQDGYWQDSYVPHSLLIGDTVVANTSVSIIGFDLYGEKRKCIQIGTVMTAPEYRNMGLSRYLMERIMDEWAENCDLVFLFANDSVVNFYPKFGFIEADEYQLHKEVSRVSSVMLGQKVDMDDIQNREALITKIKLAKPISSFAMKNNIGLIMFYCTSFMKDNVYYLSEYDAFVIAEISRDTLFLIDVFCELDVTLDEIINGLATVDTKKVELGFTPKSTAGFDKRILAEDNSTLFVFGKDADRFAKCQIMFPVLSRA